MKLVELDIAQNAKSWVYKEAVRIFEGRKHKINFIKNTDESNTQEQCILFETGYGPSGLPHIGTFAEVLRSTFIRNAFNKISNVPTKLICFSDDMDGLRKVPTNIPNQEMISRYIGMPLTKVPDPFEQEKSFGHFMNKKLMSFLDAFGFDYEFASATEYYQSGKFDAMLLKVLDKYEDIMNIMLPTLRDERRSTYSPFMPICKKTGQVLQVPIIEVNKNKKTIIYKDLDGDMQETEVVKGKCKLQWKPDFGMRWAALQVDYEMYGKDHRPNTQVYSEICTVLGQQPPIQFFYEMFLDSNGEKISKSKGNSISIDEWLAYAPLESLSLYIYQNPTRAKRLYFDVIPKAVDEYLTFNEKYHKTENIAEQIDNPVYHIHDAKVPKINMHGLSFALLLNLASICNPDTDEIMWGFIKQYAREANRETDRFLSSLISYARKYYDDFIEPTKKFITPNENHKKVLRIIADLLRSLDDNVLASEIQNQIYTIGKEHYSDLKLFFKDIYQILLGQEQGPRLGSFIKLYGIDKTIGLIESKIQ